MERRKERKFICDIWKEKKNTDKVNQNTNKKKIQKEDERKSR